MALPLAGIGGILGGLGQLGGGLASIFGGGQSNAGVEVSRINAEQDRAFQMAAATQGIRWKVADAQAAGIHPLFALSAQTFNPSPTSITSDGYAPNNMGSALSSMGQGVERALLAAAPKNERTQTINGILMEEQAVERGALQNELLKTQIASLQARIGPGQMGPPGASLLPAGPIPGQTDMPGQGRNVFENKPAEITTVNPQSNVTEAGPSRPQIQWAQTANGGLQAFPNTKLGMEDELGAPMSTDWLIRNRALPFLLGNSTGAERPPANLLPQGATGWEFSRRSNAWFPTYPDGRDYIHRAPTEPYFHTRKAMPRIINNP